MGIEKTCELIGRLDLKMTPLGETQKDEFLNDLLNHLSKTASAFKSDGGKVKSISISMKEMLGYPDRNLYALLYLDIGEHVQDVSFGKYDSEKAFLTKLLNKLYKEAKAFKTKSVKVEKFLIQTM